MSSETSAEYGPAYLYNTSLDGTPYVAVTLPENLEKFSDRILDLNEIACISVYHQNINMGDKKKIQNKIFDAEEFVGIAICYSLTGKYSVFALHESLKCGPEFHIRTGTDEITKKLRKIVEDWLKGRTDLYLKINNFT